MATKGKQLRFNRERERERERERSCFSCGRRGRRVLEFFYVGTLPWTKLPGSWWPCTLTSSPASLRSPQETFLSNSTEREKTGAGSNLGQTSSRTQASSSSWSRQTEMGAERLAAASSTPHVRRRRNSSSSRSLSSCAVRRCAVSWSICSWTRRWLVLNHETVKQTRQTDQRNAKQFSSTASDATPPAVL